MKRRLFTVLSVASLLLCIAACVVWHRSYRVFDSAEWDRHQSYDRVMPGEHGLGLVEDTVEIETGYFLRSQDGVVRLGRYSSVPAGLDGPPVTGGSLTPTDHSQSFSFEHDEVVPDGGIFDSPPSWSFLGFELNSTQGAIDVGIPFWFIALLAILLPAWRIVTFFRRRRHRLGICARCGYDLRATPDRCPECGAVPIGAKS